MVRQLYFVLENLGSDMLLLLLLEVATGLRHFFATAGEIEGRNVLCPKQSVYLSTVYTRLNDVYRMLQRIEVEGRSFSVFV